MEYHNKHRRFLQLCMNLGIIEVQAAAILFSKLEQTNESEEAGDNDPTVAENKLDKIVAEINEKITHYNQKIVKIRYDLNKKTYYTFINTNQTQINKFQTVYNEEDLNFFRLIVDEMILSGNFKIRSITCLNLNTQLTDKKITKTHAEELIEEWIEQGYFHENNNDIYFGPRFIAEFAGYAENNFKTVVNDCLLCKKIILISKEICLKCNVGFHEECLSKYIKRALKCPSCKEDWESTPTDNVEQ